ncbi:MAG: S41 family peptidase [Pirellulales bacterium]
MAILLAIIVSIACYQQAQRSLYGRFVGEALDKIHQRALEDVPREQLFAAAVRAMTDELDEYSGFVPRQDAAKYREDLDQHFVGIGVELHVDPETSELRLGNTIIGRPHPAWDAGLRPGDRIVAIGGKDALQWTADDAARAIRGPAGVPVEITVRREGEAEPIHVTVVRSEIDVDSVLGDYRGDDKKWVYRLRSDPRIAYVRLRTFGDQTVGELRTVLTDLKRQGELNALIVDVRDNAGGYLKAAVEICDMFVDRGVIVTTRGRDGAIKDTYSAKAEGTFLGFPMVVLVNRESASASEIFAACLQDQDRAKLIGARSWGKGSVQEMISVEGGESILKLTTSSFWRPSEKNIHRLKDAEESHEWGVQPDEAFRIEATEESEKQRREARQAIDRFDPGKPTPEAAHTLDYDPALQRAVEYLKQQLDAANTARRAA